VQTVAKIISDAVDARAEEAYLHSRRVAGCKSFVPPAAAGSRT
jgi:hypothetical protein